MALKSAKITRFERFHDAAGGAITKIFFGVSTSDDVLPGGAYFEHWIMGAELSAMLTMRTSDGAPDYAAQRAAAMALLLPMARQYHAEWATAEAQKAANPVDVFSSDEVASVWGTADVFVE